MNYLVCFMNLFFVPSVSVYIYSKRTGQLNKPLDIFCICSIWICVIFALMHFVRSIFSHIFSIYIPLDDGKYTVIALIVAFFMPYICEIFAKSISIKCKIERKQ